MLWVVKVGLMARFYNGGTLFYSILSSVSYKSAGAISCTLILRLFEGK